MYMPMNIHIHYLLFVTLCGQFCSWVNKSYYYYYYYIPKITSNPRKKARLQDSIDREILDALNKPPDEDEAFFISITPAVRKMFDEDKLDFKMQVLQVIKNINNKNRYAPPSVPASPIHSNYLYSQQSQQSNSRYNLSPGPSTSHF
jgi:hypothetical protein